MSTRDDLLEAARTVVRRHGLAGATSREITATAGANLAAITYHFGSKDDLLAEALFGELERRVEPALSLLGSDDPPEVRLLAVVQALTDEFERARDDIPVYFEALLLAARDDRYRRRALGVYEALRRQLADTIAQLVEHSQVPVWVDPPSTAALIVAVAHGIALESVVDPSGPDHRAMSSAFAQLLIAARETGGSVRDDGAARR
ncbi:MAG TPA: TetR family transcriptional regulator C-terminal domain-containing protein [Acidimicrobiales bacterium]|nr:TetR family transcriptional regulator C-terminal domain-containing protein [Acidimicrobiales bacterium]